MLYHTDQLNKDRLTTLYYSDGLLYAAYFSSISEIIPAIIAAECPILDELSWLKFDHCV
jgi:hypothetical protein